MAREDVEALRAEIESLTAERSRLKKEHAKVLDDHHREWKEKISHAKKERVASIRSHAREGENAQKAAQAVLVQELEDLRLEREKAIKNAEATFEAGREAAVSRCSDSIERSQQYHLSVSRNLEYRLKEHLEELDSACRASHDEMVASQDQEMKAVVDVISKATDKLPEIGAS